MDKLCLLISPGNIPPFKPRCRAARTRSCTGRRLPSRGARERRPPQAFAPVQQLQLLHLWPGRNNGPDYPGPERLGIPTEHVHYETSGPATVKSVRKATPETASSSGLEVAFSRSGKNPILNGTHPSLLDSAEANGVMFDSGCRVGNCGTCLTAIRSNKVDYLSEPGAPIEEGSCPTCIAVRQSKLNLDA